MLKLDEKILGTLLLTAIGVAMAAVATSSFVSFPAKLSLNEKKLTTFSPTIPKLTIRTPAATAGVNCPVSVRTDQLPGQAGIAIMAAFPPGVPPAPDLALPVMPPTIGSPGPAVSFIMLDAGKRLAIINGRIVKEGERFQNGTVSRIERNRVLFTEGKREQWLLLN